MKRILKRIWNRRKEIFGGVCCLLAASIAALGATSFAKYADGTGVLGQGSVGHLVSAVEVDSVDSRTFNNGEYYLDEDKNMRMNFIRNIGFSVKNFEGEEVSALPMEYEIVFYAPQVFAGRLALQLLDATGKAAVLPQLVLPELIDAGENGTAYTTDNADGYDAVTVDEQGAAVQDVTMSVEKRGERSYFATAADGSLTVQITPEVRELKQTIAFRLYDVSWQTTQASPTVDRETGTVLSPLTMDYTAQTACYRIALKMPRCKLPSITQTTHTYTLGFAPIESLSGGTVAEATDDVLGGAIESGVWGTVDAPSSLYAGKEVTVGTTAFTIDSLYYQEVSDTQQTQTVYFTEASPFAIYDEGKQVYFVSECYSKTYPCTISAKFTQLAESEM